MQPHRCLKAWRFALTLRKPRLAEAYGQTSADAGAPARAALLGGKARDMLGGVNRYVLRTVAIIVGLTLGFLCAGYVTLPSLLGPAQAQTAETPAASQASPEVIAGAHEAPHEAHADAGEAAAAGLIPLDEAGRPATPHWYRYMVWGIVGLFAAALGVGIPLTRLNRGER